MKRRLNYTERRSLDAECVQISLHEQTGNLPSRFSARIEIPKSWNLNPDAKVYVEPYVASTTMRFSFGTVKAIIHPSDTSLYEVDEGSVLFRVKVVDESGELGMLLAAADEVRPSGQATDKDEGERSFFPLVMKDLGQAVWKVEITQVDRPRLVLNNQIPGLREQLLSDPILRGAILPHALDVVLNTMLYSGEFSDSDWVADWKRYVEALEGRSVFPVDDVELEDDEKARIIESAVSTFIDAKKFGEIAKNKISGG